MKILPIGVQSFERIRKKGMLYVDKTARLLELICQGAGRYFLSRPRRFGKSLTVATLEAMFQGRAELFQGMAAESWVAGQTAHPSPVLRLDMSRFRGSRGPEELDALLAEAISSRPCLRGLDLAGGRRARDVLASAIEVLHERKGPVVVLVDEYDAPILENIAKPDKARAMRELLHDVYSMLKVYDDYIDFIFLTGISKFSKTGLFSSLNNLQDISMSMQYGDIVGYTQNELEQCFIDWIEDVSLFINLDIKSLLSQLKDYYDGFSFDGKTKVYNPFSILNFFSDKRFSNYWYDSAQPSFLVEWIRRHHVQPPEKYRHIRVASDFVDAKEIENANIESFLFQSGYLTIEKFEGSKLILDIPNKEVLSAFSRTYLRQEYDSDFFIEIADNIWDGFKSENIDKILLSVNKIFSIIPHSHVKRNEFWYHDCFVMLLHCVGMIPYAEVQTVAGRSDVIVQTQDHVYVIEFKFAKDSGDVPAMRREGEAQLRDKRYAQAYEGKGKRVVELVFVADDETRCIVL
ncbi:MAG: AAA family ATPase [Desulfovibrio sp.]|nr:AAA family ATPase [Desulfovibrio sp.]MBR6467612.1 AAA family ATPase [Desulfovibrio sp.]